jgi:hypothetical protein
MSSAACMHDMYSCLATASVICEAASSIQHNLQQAACSMCIRRQQRCWPAELLPAPARHQHMPQAGSPCSTHQGSSLDDEVVDRQLGARGRQRLVHLGPQGQQGVHLALHRQVVVRDGLLALQQACSSDLLDLRDRQVGEASCGDGTGCRCCSRQTLWDSRTSQLRCECTTSHCVQHDMDSSTSQQEEMTSAHGHRHAQVYNMHVAGSPCTVHCTTATGPCTMPGSCMQQQQQQLLRRQHTRLITRPCGPTLPEDSRFCTSDAMMRPAGPEPATPCSDTPASAASFLA